MGVDELYEFVIFNLVEIEENFELVVNLIG